MTGNEIMDAIDSGAADDQLDGIFEVLKARRRQVSLRAAAANKASMDPGDEVVISGLISPKYLLGLTGKVSERDLNPKAGVIRIDIDPGQYTGKYGTRLGVPASCLTLVRKATASV